MMILFSLDLDDVISIIRLIIIMFLLTIDYYICLKGTKCNNIFLIVIYSILHVIDDKKRFQKS